MLLHITPAFAFYLVLYWAMAVQSNASAADTTATMNIERENTWVGALSDWDIKVNGMKIGTLSSGEAKALPFIPKKGSKNFVHVEDRYSMKSNEVAFEVSDGGTVNLVAMYKNKHEAPRETYTYFIPLYDLMYRIPKSLLDKEIILFIKDKEAIDLKNNTIVAVSLDSRLKSIVLKESPPIRLARGTEKIVEDTLLVRHSVTISSNWQVDANVKAAVGVLWASAQVDIKAAIEKSTQKNYSVEIERKRSVTLKGDGEVAGVKVVWVEYYRTGLAQMNVNGEIVEVPFEFKEDFDLLTEEVEQ